MKRILFILLLLTILSLPVFAQIDSSGEYVSPYSKGSQTFTMNSGLFIPLFFYFPALSPSFESAAGHLSLGGTGSLEWSMFISDRISLGLELAGTFAFTPNMNTHVLIPLTGKISYVFPVGSFEIPVFFGTGLAVNKVSNQVYFGTILKPGASAYWNMNLRWGFGLTAQYWIVPEIYFGDNSDHTSIGNFMDVSLSARYHF